MNTNYDLLKDQSIYTMATHLVSLISSVLLMLILGCTRFIVYGDHAFWNDYRIVLYLLLFMTWTYFMDSLIFLIHTSVSFSCPIYLFFQFWLSNQSTMLTSAFAVLLVRRFKLTSFYLFIPFSISLLLGLISFAFTQQPSLQYCWYGNNNQVEALTLYAIPQGICILFNLGVILYVLITKSSSLPTSYTIYLLIPLVTQLGNLVAKVYNSVNNNNGALIRWALLTNGLGGVIIFLVFFLDPLFWHGATMLSRSIFSKAADDEETTLGNKRHTNLTDTSDLESIKSTSSISAPVMTTLKAPSHRQYYQSSLSPHQRDTPIILFPPPPPPPQFTPGNPTSLEVDESDFVDIFVKPQVDTSSNNNNSSTPGVLSPTTICYEMEDAVPWRVLEADDTDEPTLPRTSSVSSHRKEESWLSLYDEDTKEEDDPRINTLHLSSSFSSSSSSPTVMSEWLTRRGDSFDGMREQVGRTSRSIRRWCRNVNKLDDDLPHEDSRLHVVHEEQSQ